MPFTPNILRLMRDYNGHILYSVPGGAMAGTFRPTEPRRSTSEGLSYETYRTEYFSHTNYIFILSQTKNVSQWHVKKGLRFAF